MAVTIWELFGVWGCLVVVFVSVGAMKGIPIGPLAQWGKDFTYYLTPFFCLVNWDIYYPGSACWGTDLPPDRIRYMHSRNSCPVSVSRMIERQRWVSHRRQTSLTQGYKSWSHSMTSVSVPELNKMKNSSTFAVSVPINLYVKLGFVSVNGPGETYFVDALHKDSLCITYPLFWTVPSIVLYVF